jgi:DDE superfamily endonuclease
MKTNMFPLRGWCRRGGRLHAKVPHGHWKTVTFVAALRCEGIDAPCVFDGPINGASFKAYVEQVLAPALRPGDVVVMDNSPPAGGVRRAPLGSHKGQRDPSRHSRRWRSPLIPAALFARSQPSARHSAKLRLAESLAGSAHRASLRKTQNTHPKSRTAYRRWPLAMHRRFARSFHAQRMRQLPPQRRIRTNPRLENALKTCPLKTLPPSARRPTDRRCRQSDWSRAAVRR